MKRELLWGTIGTGEIAADFARALKHSERCRITNVSSASLELAQQFAAEFDIQNASKDYLHLLRDPDVHAVYVATPHTLHEEHALAAIQAGKHVLCEKPITLSVAGARRLQEAARERGVFLMEGYMYRCHPATSKLIDLLRENAIGRVRHVRADFGFRAPREKAHRLFNPELAGGGIYDVGGYPVSFACLVAGVLEEQPFAVPTQMDVVGHRGPTGVDELSTAQLSFEGGMSAQVTCAIYHDVGTSAVIYGDEGTIVLPEAWLPGGDRQGTVTRISVHRDDRNPLHIDVKAPPVYQLEAELVLDSLPRQEPAWPASGWDDTLNTLGILERWHGALDAVQPG